MDALEFVRERNRMCKSFGDGDGCKSCPVFYKEGNRCMTVLWREEIIPIIEKWSKENPCKTRQSEFLKQYPETTLDKCGVITICPATLSSAHRNNYGGCKNTNNVCIECRREFWNQEVE